MWVVTPSERTAETFSRIVIERHEFDCARAEEHFSIHEASAEYRLDPVQDVGNSGEQPGQAGLDTGGVCDIRLFVVRDAPDEFAIGAVPGRYDAFFVQR